MKTVLITGARGFIARHLAQTLAAGGHRVIGISRTGGELGHYDITYAASLGDSLWPVLTGERVDAVVHTALDAEADAFARNVSGTTKWLQEAQHAGVETQLFLSSLSADAAALADYGRGKYALEQKFIEAGQIVFRLGVVVGPGGMFARMIDSATRYPVVPMLDGGGQLVYALGIDTLAQITRDVVVSGDEALRGRAWNLQQPQPYTLREVIESILRGKGSKRALIPLPAKPILGLLTAFERQRLVRLPVTSTNVRGLIQAGRRTFPSDYERFGYPVRHLDELVAAALVGTTLTALR